MSHILFWGASEDEILKEITQHYSGEVVIARDLIEIK